MNCMTCGFYSICSSWLSESTFCTSGSSCAILPSLASLEMSAAESVPPSAAPRVAASALCPCRRTCSPLSSFLVDRATMALPVSALASLAEALAPLALPSVPLVGALAFSSCSPSLLKCYPTLPINAYINALTFLFFSYFFFASAGFFLMRSRASWHSGSRIPLASTGSFPKLAMKSDVSHSPVASFFPCGPSDSSIFACTSGILSESVGCPAGLATSITGAAEPLDGELSKIDPFNFLLKKPPRRSPFPFFFVPFAVSLGTFVEIDALLESANGFYSARVVSCFYLVATLSTSAII